MTIGQHVQANTWSVDHNKPSTKPNIFFTFYIVHNGWFLKISYHPILLFLLLLPLSSHVEMVSCILTLMLHQFLLTWYAISCYSCYGNNISQWGVRITLTPGPHNDFYNRLAPEELINWLISYQLPHLYSSTHDTLFRMCYNLCSVGT